MVHIIGIDLNDPQGLKEYLGDRELDTLSGTGTVDHLAFNATDLADMRGAAEAPQRGFSRAHRALARTAPGVLRGSQRRHHRAQLPRRRSTARGITAAFVDAVHRPRAARPRHRRLARRPLHRQPAAAPGLGRRGVRAVRPRRSPDAAPASSPIRSCSRRSRASASPIDDTIGVDIAGRVTFDRGGALIAHFAAAAESHDLGTALRAAESGISRRTLSPRLFIPTPGAGCRTA